MWSRQRLESCFRRNICSPCSPQFLYFHRHTSCCCPLPQTRRLRSCAWRHLHQARRHYGTAPSREDLAWTHARLDWLAHAAEQAWIWRPLAEPYASDDGQQSTIEWSVILNRVADLLCSEMPFSLFEGMTMMSSQSLFSSIMCRCKSLYAWIVGKTSIRTTL